MSKILDWIKNKEWEYKTRGNEIDLKICPVCGAVSTKTNKESKANYWSFSINLEKGYYKCLRGSCGAQGHINTLSRQRLYDGKYTPVACAFKENEFMEEFKKKIGAVAVTINDVEKNVKEKAENNLLTNRGISSKTLQKMNCLFNKIKGDLFIPALENGIAVNFKRRYVESWENDRGQMIKSTNAKTGKHVFYGMHNCIEFDKPLLIVEGDYELLSVVEAGYNNVVSIPNGAGSVDFIESCWEFLDNFKEITLWYDNDKAGEKGKSKMSKLLIKWKLRHIVSVENDANEVLTTHGKEKVLEYIRSSKELKLDGISDLSTDVVRKKMSQVKAVACGIYGIDRVMRGIRKSELTIWSGKNNHGKSTLIGQFILNLVENDEKVFLYSGELSKAMIKEWIWSQACTMGDLVKYKDKVSYTDEYEVKDDVWEKINKWAENRIFIYDRNNMPTEEIMIETMERAYYQKGCQHFFIDNMIMMNLKAGHSDKWVKQIQFMNKFKEFIMEHKVHGNLVVHPYKTEKELITKDDVGGTGEITSLADNVLIVHRLEKGEKFNGKERNHHAMVNIDKGRIGRRSHVYLDFNEFTKRYFTPSDMKEENFKYGWHSAMTAFNNKAPKEEMFPVFTGSDGEKL